MDGQKLTRTNSSLLRSSPTLRSSIHSMSSIYEEETGTGPEYNIVTKPDTEEEKPHFQTKPGSSPLIIQPGSFNSLWSVPHLVYSNRFFIPVLSSSIILTIFWLILNPKKPGSIRFNVQNLVLGSFLLLICSALFFFKNRYGFGSGSLTWLGFMGQKKNQEKVQWFIGSNGSVMRKSLENEFEGQNGHLGEYVEWYSNGDYYEGEFNNGRSNGSGVYSYVSGGGKYEGEWVDGRYDGYGIESWVKGSKYRGMYRGGLRHGYGVYKFWTEDSYAGEWCNGQSHGVGVQGCFDGSRFVGEFKCGVKHGLGSYQFRNGDRYAGEYFEDKIHGFGVYNFANGHCYEGSWHEGRKWGFGIYTFRSGETKFGEWDGGVLKNPLPTLTDPVFRALQAARRARENALRLRQVDEQVKKSVVSANRAAVAARVAAVKAVQNRMSGNFCDTGV